MMTLRDVKAREKRLRDYYRRAMMREPGTDGSGVPLVPVLLQSFDGTPAWARQVDAFLAEHWPGEHDASSHTPTA